MIKDHAQAIEILSNCIPYFSTVKSIDFSREDSVRFDWYGIKYMVDLSNCHVEEVQGHLLTSGSNCMLMSVLIKKQVELNSKL